jgi:S-disulfanyl-L-cysteine oxidoreductase SoxD
VRRPGLLFTGLLFVVGIVYVGAETARDSLGHTPTREEMRQWDRAVLPDGTGLPHGMGTAVQGEKLYAQRCAACHGPRGDGTDALGPQLVGGIGTLNSKHPVLTVGSYWPYGTSVWDYIHRAMPYPKPGSLTADETYAVTAYILYLNGIVKKDEVLNERSLPTVRMPNRDGFVPDPRPDTARKVLSK